MGWLDLLPQQVVPTFRLDNVKEVYLLQNSTTLPKRAPAHVTLAQVEVRGRLLYQPLHLLRDRELLTKFAARQPVLDTANHALYRALVERFGLERESHRTW